jgi:cell wall-associated NlpC family hydrolase
MKKIFLIIICSCISLFAAAQQRVVIGLTGDITLNAPSAHGKSKLASPSLTEDWFKDAAPILQDADVTIGNLHGSLFDQVNGKGKRAMAHSEYMIPTRYAKVLKEAGFDVLTVASNHGMDFGEAGRTSTIKTLKEAGLSFAGFNDGYEFASIQSCGISIAICAFGHGKNIPSINDIDKATTLIKRLKQQYDLVIVSFHGGASGLPYSRVPFREERVGKQRRGDVCKFAHACIDAGAALVFGHGSQVPRAIEFYKNRLIAYSLGSFCTPSRTNMHKALSYAPLLKVQLTKNGELLTGKIYSFIQKHNSGPITDERNLAAKEIIRLSKLDFPKSDLIIEKEGWLSKEVMKRIIVPTKSGNKVATVVDTNPEDYNPINTLISYSKRLLGSRYARGHSGGGVFDCSGLMKAVYAKIGYKLNPSSRAQYTQGRPVTTDNLRPGDLVFWRGSRRGGIGHVGMVVEVTGPKSFKFIHAANSSRGVVIDNYPDRYYFSSRYVGARRILP